jgi:hypothetical protein
MKIKHINICYPVPICPKKVVTPQDFLSWAKSDLKGSERRARGNALSNIKKTIHSRIDEILNLSHIVYSKDWDTRAKTDAKINILKKLNIEHTAIVKIITKIRNEYEHQYILPSDINEIVAYYETTELWLNHSYNTIVNSRLALVNLPVISVESDNNREIKSIEFPMYVENVDILYFLDIKKTLKKLSRLDRDKSEKMNDLSMSEYIHLEKQHLKKSSQVETYFLSQSKITKVFNTYKKTLQKVKYGFNLGNPKLDLS